MSWNTSAIAGESGLLDPLLAGLELWLDDLDEIHRDLHVVQNRACAEGIEDCCRQFLVGVWISATSVSTTRPFATRTR